MHKWTELIEKCLKNNRNIVLVGAPGTGKVFHSRQTINDIGEKENFLDFNVAIDFNKIKKDKINIIDGFFRVRSGESWKEELINKIKMFNLIDDSIRSGYKNKSIIFTATPDEIKTSLEKPLLDRCVIIDFDNIEPLK